MTVRRALFLRTLAVGLAAMLTGCVSWQSWNPEIYDPKANGEQQLTEALRQARTEHKRVLLDLGASWCGDSQAMFRLFNTNAEIRRVIEEHYVFEMIDVNQHGFRARNAELAARLGNPIAAGIPALLVLDENGVVLNSDPDERLADSDHAHPTIVLAYLRKWAGPGGR